MLSLLIAGPLSLSLSIVYSVRNVHGDGTFAWVHVRNSNHVKPSLVCAQQVSRNRNLALPFLFHLGTNLNPAASR